MEKKQYGTDFNKNKYAKNLPYTIGNSYNLMNMKVFFNSSCTFNSRIFKSQNIYCETSASVQ